MKLLNLIDSTSILERVNKNLILEVMENIKKNNKSFFRIRKYKIPPEYLTSWTSFIFDDYFPFIFDMAEKAHFVNQEFLKKKRVVPFDRFTSQDVINEAIKKKKILVSLYKAPEWFSKSYHQLSEREKEDEELSDYLFICYNSTEEEGRKVTVSLHTHKKPHQVLDAELNYKKPFTKYSLIGVTIALISLALNVAKYFGHSVSVEQIITFGPSVLLLISIGFILADVRNVLGNIRDGSVNKLITKYKKSMKRRLNSTHTLLYLETFNRRIDSTIALNLFMILHESPDKMFFNDTSLLRLVQKNLDESITSHQLNYILDTLIDNNMIKIQEDYEITLLLEETILLDKRVISQKLVSIFNLPEELEENLYDMYSKFRTLVLEICKIADLNPPQFPELQIIQN